jgi:hypothetical protein
MPVVAQSLRDGEVRLVANLGYFLMAKGVNNFVWKNLPYRGVDRDFLLPTEGELAELHESGRGSLAETWESWWNAKEDGSLKQDRNLAMSIVQDLTTDGVAVEVIYVELIDEDHQTEHDQLHRPGDLHFLGYDVSRPRESFHSAIYEPGAELLDPMLPNALNAFGLLSNLTEAQRIAKTAEIKLPAHAPYCVLAVYEV